MLKTLKESNLSLKQDIQYYALLVWSCHTTCQLRFDYRAEMDQEGLKRQQGKPLIHIIINSRSSEVFQQFLTTALKHHPEEIGLLFQKDDAGKTAFECALHKDGNEATFGAIEQCIPLDGADSQSFIAWLRMLFNIQMSLGSAIHHQYLSEIAMEGSCTKVSWHQEIKHSIEIP